MTNKQPIIFLRAVLLLFFIFTAIICNAQEQTVKLEASYTQAIDSSEYYLKRNPDKALTFASNALEISRKLKDEEKLARCYLQLGIIHRLSGNLSRSQFHLDKALALGKKFDFYPMILKESGITLKQQSNFNDALQQYLKAIAIFQEKNQLNEVAMMNNNIGRLYFAMGDENKALIYYRKSVSGRRVNLSGTSNGISFHNIGAVMEKLNQRDSAIFYYRKALESYKKNNDQILIAYGYASLGNLLADKDTAEFYLLKSIEIRKELKLEGDILESLFFLGKFRMKQNQEGKAALIFIEVYDKSIKNNKHQFAFESAAMLSEIYRHQNDYGQAYRYEKYATAWKDSLYKQEKKVKELGFDYRLKQLQQAEQLDYLNKANKNKALQIRASEIELEKERQLKLFSFITILLSVALTGVLFVFFVLQRRKNTTLHKQKDIIEKQSKENEILIREVHHRVKNNLSSVMSLLRLEKRKIKDPSADRLVENMENRILNISFIHEILFNHGNLTSIALQDYLNTIGQKIFSLYPEKKISLVINGDLTVDSDTALYLGQLFSELFTNSCKHAFSATDSPTIKLKIESLAKNKCLLTYADNGSGIKHESKNDSFGKKLIESHGRKLNAEIKEFTKDGFCCTIEFKLT